MNIRHEYETYIFRTIMPKFEDRYFALLQHLHRRPFEFIHHMDENRMEDGRSLRWRFVYENPRYRRQYQELEDIPGCSILEMMVALAFKLEDTVESPNEGCRVGLWFWDMIVSLGLQAMDSVGYDKKMVDKILDTFVDRRYSRNGRGGLFTLSKVDTREMEIWTQMLTYITQKKL